LHDLDLVLAIPLLRLLTRAKIIYDSHEAYPQQFLTREAIPSGLRGPVARIVGIVEKGMVRLVRQVITADNPTGRSFVETGVRTDTIFNYPPLRIFETDETKLQAEKNRYADRVPIIYQGTMSADRGLFHMIDALPLIKKVEPGILLRLVGLRDPRLKAQANARAADAGVLESIEIVEWVPHLELAYPMKSSLIGLIPLQPTEKYKRNIPIKLFEYMACGLPVVAADIPSIARYLNRVEAGVLYDSTRPEELARCVLELLADPERRRHMAQAGVQAVRDHWNWERMEKELLNIYEALSGPTHGPATL
jgi:glycosyltransferase involved in cell wall biosynthesis